MVAVGVGGPTPFFGSGRPGRAWAVKAVKDEELTQFLERALAENTAIYSASISEAGDSYHFDVALDGLSHPTGAVSTAECEEFSCRLAELIDAGGAPLPPALTAENYSLEVSSAGAERALRLPQDLERFMGQPIRLHFVKHDRRREELVTFVGTADGGTYRFVEYVPRRKRNRGGRNARSRGFFGQENAEAVELKLEEMESGNLYLDF